MSETCLLLRRECIRQIGGFDESFHSYTEDRDLGYRANDAGWGVGRLTTTKVTGLGSVIGDAPAPIYRSNQILLSHKRGGSVAGWKYLMREAAAGFWHALLSLRPGEHGRYHRMLAVRNVRVVRRAAVLLRRS